MFTGIIEELGTVKALHKTGSIARLQVFAPKVSQDARIGQSICVNGACLTVIGVDRDLLSFEVMQETLKRTDLGLLQSKDKVNLERALKVDGRLDGHFVSGHVDDTGRIKEKIKKGQDVILTVETSLNLLRYIVLKGSVSLDGVSLTVSAQENTTFEVNLIPHTVQNTTLGLKKEHDIVNIECDILAKYIERFLFQKRLSSESNLTLAFLREHGFTP